MAVKGGEIVRWLRMVDAVPKLYRARGRMKHKIVMQRQATTPLQKQSKLVLAA